MMSRKQLDFYFSGPEIPLVMGPTASGKSALAMEISRVYQGEIISADSMQFYRGLDIGTAKPSAAERAEVKHHLIDTLELTRKSDIFSFCEMAERAIADIRGRGKLPVIAGGSGLYIHALMYGLDPLPADESLRRELDAKFDSEEGFAELKSIMEKTCPGDYARWYNHRRKLIRAYEVFLLTGTQISVLQKKRTAFQARKDIKTFYLEWDRDILKKRIAERCAEMLESGWIEETKNLMAQGLFETPTARQALGYPIIARYLAGEFKKDKLAEEISIATWQFARRQITWFRNRHPEATVIPLPKELK